MGVRESMTREEIRQRVFATLNEKLAPLTKQLFDHTTAARIKRIVMDTLHSMVERGELQEERLPDIAIMQDPALPGTAYVVDRERVRIMEFLHGWEEVK